MVYLKGVNFTVSWRSPNVYKCLGSFWLTGFRGEWIAFEGKVEFGLGSGRNKPHECSWELKFEIKKIFKDFLTWETHRFFMYWLIPQMAAQARDPGIRVSHMGDRELGTSAMFCCLPMWTSGSWIWSRASRTQMGDQESMGADGGLTHCAVHWPQATPSLQFTSLEHC